MSKRNFSSVSQFEGETTQLKLNQIGYEAQGSDLVQIIDSDGEPVALTDRTYAAVLVGAPLMLFTVSRVQRYLSVQPSSSDQALGTALKTLIDEIQGSHKELTGKYLEVTDG